MAEPAEDAPKPAPAPAPGPPPPKPTFKMKVDGVEIEAKAGETILQACMRNGHFVPHYCYHPGLSIAGNCRICLVHSSKSMPPGKPVIACQTLAVEGDEVELNGPRTKTVREGVMEFLLINHPLDCPVCDQAGECDLQQYSFDYGKTVSRFAEPKTQKPNKDFGPLVRFNGDRCINCTRCVRFCDEVAGTGELGQINRGDRNHIDVFPGIQLDNPLSACTADICPVGALLDRDFIHRTRVWLLRGTKTVCGHCATGCNINAEWWNERIQRLTPRENQAVNRWWMCDEGRLSYKEAYSTLRLDAAKKKRTAARFDDAMLEAASAVANAVAAKKPVVGLATGHATNEELYSLKKLVEASGSTTPVGAVFAKDGAAWRAKDGFEISADRNPNRRGVELLLGADAPANVEKVREALDGGSIAVAIVLGGVPGGADWKGIEGSLRRAETIVYIGVGDASIVERADYVLPGAHWLEKDGTFVNRKGRVQRARPAVPPPRDSRPDVDVLQQMLRRAEGERGVAGQAAPASSLAARAVSAASIFKRLAAEPGSPFAGLDYQRIGEQGVPLEGAEDKVPPEQARTWYEAGPVSRDPGRALDEQTRVSVHRARPAGSGTRSGA